MSDTAVPQALVIGEALVDVIEDADGVVTEAPGGSPLNVAITLGRLGVETRLLTALGDDGRADRIEAHLKKSGVRLVEGARRLVRTATAHALLQADGSARYEFDVEWAPAGSRGAARATVVHAGSIALFVSPGSSSVRGWLEDAASEPGTVISLDPNIRPSLLPPRDEVTAAFDRLLPLAHVVKLSDEDARWLYPDLDDDSVLDLLLAAGPRLVALTRGGDGCVLASPEGRVELESEAVAVVDTIGAGDAFMGALLHHLLTRDLAAEVAAGQGLWPEELAQIGKAAVQVAGVTVSRPGADPPWSVEVPGLATMAESVPGG